MSNNGNINQYKQTSILTANRGQVLLMLYEAAIQNLKKAMLALDKKDLPAKGMAIGKVHDIINELSNTLDFNAGGEIAQNLERLYHFMIEQLTKANVENAKAPLEQVEKILTDLLGAWKVAVEEFNKTANRKD